MAAALSALNAKIRSQPVLNYIFSTHFWGPVSNFGIPIAAIMDAQKDPEIISGRMTAVLTVYSATFMRYALAVSPKNYLLFACHFINCGSQITQGARYLKYWNYGGREEALALKARSESLASESVAKVEQIGQATISEGKQAVADVRDAVGRK